MSGRFHGDHSTACRPLDTKLAEFFEFGKEFDLGLVAANDVHFLDRKHHEAHDVMICIGTGSLQMDENRMRYSQEVYFKTTREMTALFKDVPDAIRNTYAIADRCEVTMELDPNEGPRTTMRAVVWSMVAVFVLDAVIAVS